MDAAACGNSNLSRPKRSAPLASAEAESHSRRVNYALESLCMLATAEMEKFGLRDGGGIHDVDLLVENAVQQAGKHGALQQVRARFGELAGVAHANSRRARVGRLRDK